MKVSVSVIVQSEIPASTETIEVDFPVYVLDGYNSQEATTRRRIRKDETHFEMRKIVSPTEYVEMKRKTSVKSNGETSTSFELRHDIDAEASDSRSWFLPSESDYHSQGTLEQWDTLYKEFLVYLAKF